MATTEGDGGHIWPPRYSDPRIQAIIDAGSLAGVYKARGIVAALQESLSLTSNEYSLDDLWNRYKIANGITDTAEPFTLPSVGEATDEYWNNVVYLNNFNGLVDGDTVNDDESTFDATSTYIGNAQNDTDVKVEGTTSLQFTGSIPNVSVPTKPEFIPDVAYTMEMYYRFSSVPSGTRYAIASKRQSGAQHGWLFGLGTDSQLEFFGWGDGNSTPYIEVQGTTTLAVDTWYHLAVTRTEAGLWKLWIDGVLDNSGTETGVVTDSTNGVLFGRDITNSQYSAAHMDMVRFTRGVDRYTGSFTIPTSYPTAAPATSVDPHFSNVVFLLDMAGDDGDTTLTDLSSLAGTVTINGTTREVDDAQSYFGSDTSFYVAGSDEQILADYDASQEANGDDFTLECDVRWSVDPTTETQCLIAKYEVPNDRGFIFNYRNATLELVWSTLGWQDDTDSPISAAFDPDIDTWYRLACVRSGPTVLFYVDGTRVGTATIGADVIPVRGNAELTCLRAGTIAAEHFGAGWMDNVRVTMGVARYTGASYVLDTAAYPITA